MLESNNEILYNNPLPIMRSDYGRYNNLCKDCTTKSNSSIPSFYQYQNCHKINWNDKYSPKKWKNDANTALRELEKCIDNKKNTGVFALVKKKLNHLIFRVCKKVIYREPNKNDNFKSPNQNYCFDQQFWLRDKLDGRFNDKRNTLSSATLSHINSIKSSERLPPGKFSYHSESEENLDNIGKSNIKVLNAIEGLYNLLNEKMKDKPQSNCKCRDTCTAQDVCKAVLNRETLPGSNNNLSVNILDELEYLKRQIVYLKQQNNEILEKTQNINNIRMIDECVATEDVRRKTKMHKSVENLTNAVDICNKSRKINKKKLEVYPQENIKLNRDGKRSKINTKCQNVKSEATETLSSYDSDTIFSQRKTYLVRNSLNDLHKIDTNSLNDKMREKKLIKKFIDAELPKVLNDSYKLQCSKKLKTFNIEPSDDLKQKRKFVHNIMKDTNDFHRTVSPKKDETDICQRYKPLVKTVGKVEKRFSIKNKKHRLPSHPSVVNIGDLVRFTRNGSQVCLGIVRFIGELPQKPEIFFGLELENEDGLHDGVYLNKRYFKCPPNRGIFVSFQRIMTIFKNE